MNAVPQHVRVFKPLQRYETGFFECLWNLVAELVRSRELVAQLFKRDFLAVYKSSFVGWFWVVASPLAGIVSWVVLQRAHILSAGDVGIPYPAYVLIGTTMWGLFMGFYRAASFTLENSRHLVRAVALPHEALFGAQMLVTVADFFVTLVVTLLVLLVFRIVPSWGVLLLPLLVVPLFLLASGLGLIVCLVSAVSYDFNRVVSWAIGFMLYLTPLIYSVDAIGNPWLRGAVLANPLTYLVCSARDMVLYGTLYSPGRYFASCGLALVLFVFAWRLFYVTENRIVERMI
jgi:lipopolysaccharide transport system permease protein